MAQNTNSTENIVSLVWHKVVATVAMCCFASTQVWAASAWAYESGTGVTGHGVGPTTTKAIERARKDCENNGASPSIIVDWFSSTTPGYGAVYISDEGSGGLKLGGTLGYRTLKKAKRKAKKFCKISGGTHCQLVDTVYDPSKSREGNRRGIARSL